MKRDAKLFEFKTHLSNNQGPEQLLVTGLHKQCEFLADHNYIKTYLDCLYFGNKIKRRLYDLAGARAQWARESRKLLKIVYDSLS